MNPLEFGGQDKRDLTISDKYGPAMEITDQAEADAYFDLLVADSISLGLDRANAEARERTNLGYYAGYYSNKIRERVERLFKCEHPYFGSIAKKCPPSVSEAFEIGRKLGERLSARRASAPTERSP